jgi:mRNA interferase HicA
MKRRDVLKRIRRAAKTQGVEVTVRELTRHTGITVGRTSTTVPRHNEIADLMASVIFKQLEVELGKGWWRR